MSDLSPSPPLPAGAAPSSGGLLSFNPSFHALHRIVLLAILFVAEALVFSFWLDNESLTHATGLSGAIGNWGSWVLRGVVGFAAIFASFAYLTRRIVFDALDLGLIKVRFRWELLAAHAAALLAFARMSSVLYGPGGNAPPLLAWGWLTAGILAIVFAAFAALPARMWLDLVRGTQAIGGYAAVGALLACGVGKLEQSLWEPASRVTFRMVHALLTPLVSGVVTDPARLLIGTHRFRVFIAPQCSGLEGVGLIVIFGAIALALFRDECKFPQALLLIPIGAVTVFLLNAVRLAALVLIGNAGARQIAAGGFHSQAGWILFNAVAVGMCVSVRRIPWLTTRPAQADPPASARENPTAAYLAPFLAVLIAGMLATAASAGFEWLYGLRVAAALAVLWTFRRAYRAEDWRFDGVSILLGAVVFGVWVGFERLGSGAVHTGIPAPLTAAGAAIRDSWIAIRIAGAVVTVPIAEELAFRGYLLRRFVSVEFESVDYRRAAWWAILVSSAIFGLLHSGHRIAGVIAGAVFSGAVMRKGRIGDAVAAHAAANLLLAAYVLWSGQWNLW